MRHALLPLLLLGSLAGPPGCAGSPLARTLSFAEAQAIGPGVSAAWIRTEYPFGQVTATWPDGSPRRLRYPVTDPIGHGQTLDLDVDASGTVTARHYSGPVLRPPPNQK